MQRMPDGQRCQKCDKRFAAGRWIGEGGIFEMTHGGGAWWCQTCMTEAQIHHLQAEAGRLQRLINELPVIRAQENIDAIRGAALAASPEDPRNA